jgi:hypothetical protein
MNQHGRSTSHKTVTGQLASAVADAGTFTIAYPDSATPIPAATNAGDFYNAFFHRLVMNQSVLVYPDDFDLTFGSSSITVTNKTGATWASGSKWVAQFDEPGKKIFASDADNKGVSINRAGRADVVLISLGAPDAAVSNGICASQSIAAGTNSTATSGTLDGSLASTNATSGEREVVLDVPRNVVAAWTTTAVLAVEGYDEYGNFMVEKSASGTSLTGKKAFKKISRIWSSAAITSATVGTGDVLGLPAFLPGRQHVRAEIIDGLLVGDNERIYLPFHINSTDLLAGTAQQIVSPCAGEVVRVSTVVQVAGGTTANEIGTVHVTINGTAITGSTLTSYGTTAETNVGPVGSVASALIPASSTAAVVAGDAIGIKPSSTWASAGALNGTVEIAPTGSGLYKSGTFVAGLTTGGGSTATTGDVRGTYDPPVDCDGSIVVQLLVSLPDPGNRGAAQYSE